MLQLFKNLFRKGEPAPVAAATAKISPAEPSLSVQKVETAALSLAAIIEHFPAELKETVAQVPNNEVTVILPLPTILKQLPGGSVKMSLASVYRQAPPGTFASTRLEDKRMVEVPLREIFKHVRPEVLKRRSDQRMTELSGEGIDLFGDKQNPHAIAPTVSEPEPLKAESEPLPLPELAPPDGEPAISPQRVLRMTEPVPTLAATSPPGIEAPAALRIADDTSPAPQPSDGHFRIAPPVVPDVVPTPTSAQPPLVIPLQDLITGWPAEIVAELGSVEGATISLPCHELTIALAKGRVAFPWSQLRTWITPQQNPKPLASDDRELQLPLRVIAPAFLKHSKHATQRKSLSVDESIPALFRGGADVTRSSSEMPAPTNGAKAPGEAQPISTPAPAPKAVPTTVGEVFGQPAKAQWTPSEIVENVVTLPAIEGAVIALQEGLVVAHHLPERMKGEVVAAFLPQIFSRLNQYSNEMKLGEVDDLLFSTHGAYFQVFRVGYVFFAVLGKPGEALPRHELQLIARELATQTQN